MNIRNTVFGSGSERELFTTLASTWSDHFNLWPSLPFLSVIAVQGDEVFPDEWNALLKTSLDITLCTKAEDKPLVSVDFDGMGHGFSRDGKYIQLHPTPDPYRKLKLDLKLRVAERLRYPLFVLSYHEKNPIGPSLALTIADGIIGQVVARRHMHELLEEWLTEDRVEEMGPSYRDEYVQDQVISAEVFSELKWNPIAKLASRYDYLVTSRLGIKGVRHEILFDPELPDLEGDWMDSKYTEALIARVNAFKRVVRIGCKVWIQTPRGEFSEEIWLRNISGHGVHPMGLAEDIAKLIAFRRVAAAYGIREEDVDRFIRQ